MQLLIYTNRHSLDLRTLLTMWLVMEHKMLTKELNNVNTWIQQVNKPYFINLISYIELKVAGAQSL
jgi:hypothetical protein